MGISDIKTIVIAGAGLMGSSMGERYAEYGFNVILYDMAQEYLDRSKKLIGLHQQTLVTVGEKTQEQMQQLMDRISYTLDIADFAKADFVMEAIIEKIEIKARFYQQISQYVRPGVVVASNTSALPITELGKNYREPENLVGMHWFNPPHIIPLVEVIQGEKSSDAAASLTYDLAEHIGKKPVRVRKDAKGFIANRLQFALLREALHIVDEGIAQPEDVDRCMKYGLGFRYALFGPFEIADFGGLDTFHHISSFLNPDLCDRKDVSPRLAKLYSEGKYGVKGKEGFYDYSGGRDVERTRLRDELYTVLFNALYKEDGRV